MALIAINPDGTYGSKCALCGETLAEPIFATSHFIGDESHDLYRFSDAPMHWRCYVAWPHQARFAAMYFQARLGMAAETNPYWTTLFRSADALVQYGFAMNEISIDLRKSGTQLRVCGNEWQSWLGGGWREHCRPELELQAVADLIPELERLTLPQRDAAAAGSSDLPLRISQASDRPPPAR